MNNIIYKKNYKFILIKNSINKLKYPRLGININKKNIKYSIIRNKIKRIIRETFRLNQYKIKKIDYLIIVKNITLFNKKKIFKYFKNIWKLYYIQ